MSKSKIYTKSGDSGSTSLVGGQRISKGNKRIDLYGDIDELNCFVGMAISNITPEYKNPYTDYLYLLQSKLFDIGSNVACLAKDKEKINLPLLTDVDIQKLELMIDEMDKNLTPLKNFVMPGGVILASNLHICRTITRRVERKLVEFSVDNKNEIEESILKFVNRLSDFFFILSRHVNKIGNVKETLWVATTS